MIKELHPNFTPVQMANYYGFPTTYKGKGQKIAVISLGGKPNLPEIKKDFIDLEITPPKLNLVDIDSESISLAQDFGSTLETHLDVEIIGSICPDAEITIYRGLNATGFAAAIEKAIEDKNNVISISWGYSEYEGIESSDVEKALLKAKKHNITVCVATGDGGSGNTRSAQGTALPSKSGKAQVSYPASSPFVLACGGTELLENDGEKYEVVWNNSPIGGGATGGGVSEYFDLPEWQKDFANITSVNSGKTGRIIPDVAGLAASGDYSIFNQDQKYAAGGTSGVAPLWASLITLVNEARANNKKKPIGFVNDYLYHAAKNKTIFTPITKGNNKPEAAFPGYEASSAYNACCGLGSPIGSEIFAFLNVIN